MVYDKFRRIIQLLQAISCIRNWKATAAGSAEESSEGRANCLRQALQGKEATEDCGLKELWEIPWPKEVGN
jgi:hypothetical protein